MILGTYAAASWVLAGVGLVVPFPAVLALGDWRAILVCSQCAVSAEGCQGPGVKNGPSDSFIVDRENN